MNPIAYQKLGQSDLLYGSKSHAEKWMCQSMDCLFNYCVDTHTRLCVQRLRFVPPWLTSRHTHRHTYIQRQHLISLYEKLSQLCWNHWSKIVVYVSWCFSD